MELRLRELGFDYQAKYIEQSAEQILARHGLAWLLSHCSMNYTTTKRSLLQLPGKRYLSGEELLLDISGSLLEGMEEEAENVASEEPEKKAAESEKFKDGKDLMSKLKAYLNKANLSKLTSTPKFKRDKSKKVEKGTEEKKERFVPKQMITAPEERIASLTFSTPSQIQGFP